MDGETIRGFCHRAGNRLRVRARSTAWQVLRRLSAHRTLRTAQGIFTVSTRDQVVSRGLYVHGQHQYDFSIEVVEFLTRQGFLPPAGVCLLDIGANLGMISIGLLREQRIERAVAIEPEPANFGLLQRNVAQNGVADRVVCRQQALGAARGTVELALCSSNWGDHHIRSQPSLLRVEKPVDHAPGRVEVEVETLDQVARDVGLPNDGLLVWIDVQGYEGHVFDGGASLLASSPPTVCEVWPHGVLRSGMALEQYCQAVMAHWPRYWRQEGGGWTAHEMAGFPELVERLGPDGRHTDVVFTA